MVPTDLPPATSPGAPLPALRFPDPESEFLPAIARVDLDLVGAILAGLNARTARTYLSDYRDFARFLGRAEPGAAVAELVALGPGPANALALAYRVAMTSRGLAAGTIARRLVALRSACKAARRLGLITWGLDVPGPRPEAYRDCRGPGPTGWRAMLTEAKAAAVTPRGKRDLAIIRLLHDLALRRGEAVRLDLSDVDLEASAVAVVGKGKTDKALLTLPRPTAAALAGWIAERGDWSGALFVRLDPASGLDPTGRLTGEAVRLLVAALGRRCGLARIPKPHGLRHQSITAALDSGRDVRDVRKFSRHARLDTVLIYDDRRSDVAGDIARLIAGDD